MKKIVFEYSKELNDISTREVLVLNENSSCLDGIDLTHLTDEEKEKVNEINKRFEEEMKPFMKAFRRFSKNKMNEVK